MATPAVPILFVLDFNVGNTTDNIDDPYSSGRIAVGPATGGELKTLIDHEMRPDGIDVLLHNKSDRNGTSNTDEKNAAAGGRLFWTQMGHPKSNDGFIQSANLDGSDIKTIFEKGQIYTPKQIIIDRPSRKLYVCDREGLRVHRSNLDGSGKEILIQRGDCSNPDHMNDTTRWCVGIATDSKNGFFYWTQKGPSKGGKGSIFRAPLNMREGETAENRTDIEMLFDHLPEPIDLEIDSKTQTLYWTDRGDFPKGNTLNKADISGKFTAEDKRPYTILARHMHEAIGLKVDEVGKHIYCTDMGGDVYRYNMDGSNQIKLFESYEGQAVYTGIALAYLDPAAAKTLYGID